MRDAFKAMPVKSDRNDARGIAQLMRLGWFRPVHCKSVAAQEVRAVLTARKLVQSKLLDVENSLRGILRGFGLKVGKTTAEQLCWTDQGVGAGPSRPGGDRQRRCSRCATVLLREFNGLREAGAGGCRACDARARLLMSTPAVGPIVALTYAAAIDDPARFKSSKQAGSHFGLTPKKHQSGETDRSGPDQQDRRRLGARGALPGRPHHADEAGQGLFAAQELGDADRQAGRHEQG